MRWKVYAAGVTMACALLATIGVATAGAATTISVGAISSDQGGLDPVIHNFERAHPNIHIQVAYAPYTTLGQVLATQFQGGSAPDVVELLGGNGLAPAVTPFAKAGDLDRISSARARVVPPFLKGAVSYKGAVYALPATTPSSAIQYNVTLLQHLGLKRPQTVGDMVRVCHAIRAKSPNLTPLDLPGTVTTLPLNMIIANAMGSVYAKDPRWDQQRSAGKVSFQKTPGWRTAVEALVSLIKANCFEPGVPSQTFTQTVADMAGGKSVMSWGGDVLLGFIRTTAAASKNTDRFGMFQIVQRSKASTYIPVNANANFAVNAKASDKAAARTFVDFVGSPSQTRVASTALSVTSPAGVARARKLGTDKNGLTKADQRAIRKILGPDHAYMAPYADRIVLNPSTTWPSADITNAIAQAALGLFTGQSSVNDVLKAGDTAWSKAVGR